MAESISESYLDSESKESLNASEITRDDLEAQATDIRSTIYSNRYATLSDGYLAAREAYIDEAEDESLRDFSSILLYAPVGYTEQVRLDGAKSKQEIAELKESRTRYQHQIKDFIDLNYEAVTRTDMENWLEMSSQGKRIWAEELMLGIAGEFAARQVLRGISGVTDVRWSSPEEDLAGADLIVTFVGGQQVRVDAKTGGQIPLDEEIIKRNGVIILGIEKRSIDSPNGFEITTASSIQQLQTVFLEALARAKREPNRYIDVFR